MTLNEDKKRETLVSIYDLFDYMYRPLYGHGPLGAQHLVYGNKCCDTRECRNAFENDNYEECLKLLNAFNNNIDKDNDEEESIINEITELIYYYWNNFKDFNIIQYTNIIEYNNKLKKISDLELKSYNIINKKEFYDALIELLKIFDKYKFKNFNIQYLTIKDSVDLDILLNYLKKYCIYDFKNMRFYYNLKILRGD